MVISYNHNLHFKMYVENSRNKIIIHFIIFWYYKKSHNNIEITTEVCTFFFTKNWIKITKKIHVLLKWNQNNKINFVVYQNKICGFLLQSIYIYFYFPKNYVSKNELFFPKTPLFGQSQVTSSWLKTNKNSKFKPTMFHDQSMS
jgi:hypothetical protein